MPLWLLLHLCGLYCKCFGDSGCHSCCIMSLLHFLNQIEQFPLTHGQVYHWITCLQDEGIKISKQSIIKHMSAWCHCPEKGQSFLRTSKQHG